MSFLNPLSFEQMVQNIVQAYNAAAVANGVPVANTGPNSSLGPIFNANALLAQALQGQIQYVNSVARLVTSVPSGTMNSAANQDVISFVGQFGMTPEPQVQASGSVTFSTNSPAGSNIYIYPGVTVQTADGVQFAVIADTTQSSWDATVGAYLIPSGSTSCNATVQAIVGGLGGNVAAQTIVQILSSQLNPAPAGVANVTNSAAFTNGANAETNAALIARFQNFIQGRWGTDSAIEAAVEGVQSGLTFTIGDGLDQNGNTSPNFFTAIVNELNQSSGPSSALISSVYTQVQASRAVGLPFQVVGPTLLVVNGSVTLQLAPGSNSSAIALAAQTAFANYINNLGLGNNVVFPSSVSGATTRCSYNQIITTLAAVSGVVSLPDPPGLILNGGTVDIIAPWGTQIVAGTLTVTTS